MHRDIRLAELSLEDARFKADEARARFEAVDPRNRNVIGNLSRSWEERLEVVREREGQLATARLQLQRQEPTSEERAAYLALGADLECASNHENVTTQMRKHVLRAVLVEVIVTVVATMRCRTWAKVILVLSCGRNSLSRRYVAGGCVA